MRVRKGLEAIKKKGGDIINKNDIKLKSNSLGLFGKYSDFTLFLMSTSNTRKMAIT